MQTDTGSAPKGREEIYTQEAMVNWLGPVLLVQTGIRTLIATTLGAFADPREVQAALNPQAGNEPVTVANDGTVWLDYVADTGDGWDSTYSVAWCLARPVSVGQESLPPGQVLLLGGDQVYPTPARGGYRSRFMDPFRSACPARVPDQRCGSADVPVEEARAPLMLATPGNHDWYDGLRAFSQLFCNRKPVGRWRTAQRTSYYVLSLPHGWYVWGLDLQLDSLIDRPQREYFEAMAQRLKAGDRVILCAPEPSWVDEGGRVRRAASAEMGEIETRSPRFCSLKEIEELLGAHLVLVLAGDSHHYARYAPKTGASGPQRITCGGGGAFLHGTHQLEPSLRFFVGGQEQCCDLQRAYPDAATSKSLRNRAWRLPSRNPSFCALLAVFYLLFTWLLQSASKVPHSGLANLTLMESLSQLGFSAENAGRAFYRVAIVMAHSPGSVVFACVIAAGAAGFTYARASRWRRLALAAGALHGLLHLALTVALLWCVGRYNLVILDVGSGQHLEIDDPTQVLLFFVETLLVGGILGGLLFGLWMVLTNHLAGWHGEDVFSSQRIHDHKCFLRMRLDGAGLAIYPLKLDRVCTSWRIGAGIEVLRRSGRTWRLRAFPGAGSRFEPAPGKTLQPEPIEPPIHIVSD